MTPFTAIDRHWKVSQTATYVFFLSGPFSQWFPSRFATRGPFGDDDAKIVFNCAEQYMMAAKAALFGDAKTRDAILASNSPREQKELGRGVRDFDADRWNATARNVVTEGNLAKFSQNSRIREYLFATGEKTLVEGAWYDPVWGVALAWDNPLIVDPANWQGTNWLGECLMETRRRLLAELLLRIDPEHP